MSKKGKLYNISKNIPNKERVAWKREKAKIDKLIEKIRPLEDEILKLQAQKIPIFDEIQVIRNKMIVNCIHPHEYLVDCDDYVECKFCMKKIQLRNIDDEKV